MTRDEAAVIRVERAVGQTVRAVPRLLLVLNRESLIVATFDHGTGTAARDAARMVLAACAARGVACVLGRTGRALRGEAAWREARWDFLRGVAAREGASVATAHTRDDQLETVVIRVLRDAGARGLAGLYARGEVLRPLLDVDRAAVGAYAFARGVRYADDPTNLSRAHLRNRVRLDLLPALTRADPAFPGAMLSIAQRAAEWREQMEEIVAALGVERLDEHTLRIAGASLRGYDAGALRVLWPAIAARAGVTMDRRGTQRAAAFTVDVLESGNARRDRSGIGAQEGGGRRGVIQLSGGVEIAALADGFVLRRA
jgi:tRNA(Ile)-lysidine synthase